MRLIYLLSLQEYNSSSYNLFGRDDQDIGFTPEQAGGCGGCSTVCQPKCVAEKGSRVSD